MFDHKLKERVERSFLKLGFEINLIHVTRNSLDNRALPCRINIVQYMKRVGLHDYIQQEPGEKNRKLIDTTIISDKNITIQSATTCYKKLNRSEDIPVFWTEGIEKFIKPDDLLAVLIRNKTLFLINCNRVDLGSLRSLDDNLSADADEDISSRHDYNLLNNILNEFLFRGRYEHKDIYLDFEGDMASHLAEKLSEYPENLDNRIFDVVKSQMNLGKSNPFSTLIGLNNKWRTSGFDGFPPTTLFLCSQSLVAEGMRAGERFSFNNYYDRFIDDFKISEESDQTAIKSCFKQTEKMWRNFNSWLIRSDGIFGLPTAKPFMPTRPFVSYPISQALIRRGDRQHIREFLKSSRFNAAVEEDIGIVGEALGRWFKTTGPTKYLQNLWAHKSLRKIIISNAFDEVKNITSPLDHHQSSGGYQAKLKARFKFKNYPKKKLLISFVAKNRDGFDENIHLREPVQSGVFDDGIEISLTPENKEIAVLGPPNQIKTGPLLLRGVSLFERNGKIEYRFRPTQAMALEERADGFFYQVDRPKLFVPYTILVRKKNRKQVENFVNFCAQGDQVTIEELPGLPDDYVCIVNVIFGKSVPVDEWDPKDIVYWILPGENQTNLEFVGGLKLVGNIYHKKSRLSFLFQSEKEHEDITVSTTQVSRGVSYSSITENTYPIKIMDEFGSHDLSTINTNDADLDIEISSDNNSFSETNLSFRSASTPQREPDSQYKFKPHPSDMFAVLSCVETTTGLSDKNTSSSATPLTYKAGNKEKNILQSHKFVGDFYTENSFNEEDEDFYSSKTSAGKGVPSCIEKYDSHTWRVPDNIRGRDTHTQSCSMCGETRLWNGQNRNRTRVEKVNMLFTFPVRRFIIDKSPYDADTIFDAMCYLRSINWDVIKRLCREAYAPDLYALNFVRQLSALGHIDIELNQSNLKLKRCHVRKPHLIESNNKFFLTGFRNDEIIDELVTIIGEPVISNNETSIIKKYVFNHFDLDLENQILDVLNHTCGVEFTIIRDTNREPMGDLDATNLYSSLPPISLSTTSKFQKFNPQSCRWVEVDSIDECGGYRTQWPVTIYFIRLKNNDLVVSTAALAKIYAADVKYLRLHEYNATDRTFTSKVGCDLPPLVERALVNHTGTLPIQKTPGNFVYSNIPENMGHSILENHYGTNL